MNYDYWLKQDPTAPLFPDIEWQKPEHRSMAGKLLILGGNAHGFAAVAQAYEDAKAAGIGEVRAVLPDSLKKTIGPLALDCEFVPTNHGGGITKDSINVLKAATSWADGLLLVGDAGRNSETAIVCEQLLNAFPDKLTIITRDAIDLLRGAWPQLLQRPNTVLIGSFAQLQKLFQSVYYPKTMLFSMQLASMVDALHKFTITYPATLVVFHQDQLVVANGGRASSTPWEEPMMIWRGSVSAKAAVYAIHHKQTFQAITASFVRR